MNIDYVQAVLAVVCSVPPGQVTTYGTVAGAVGRGGARQGGHVMKLHGEAVPWWRVVYADGSPPACHHGSAQAFLRAEGTPMLPNGRIDLATASTPANALQPR